MDISNKTLALLLLAAMVVSLGGTIISVSQISDLQTGMATTPTGNVDLNVQGALSITTDDANQINFGDCTPLSGENGVINSEQGKNTTTVCSGNGNLPSNISVRNNGNVDANVTIQADDVGEAHGGSFIPSNSSGASELRYKTADSGVSGNQGGCTGTLQTSYTNITTAGTEYTGCSVLTPGSTQNSFLTNIELVVPFDATPGSSSVTLTFTANSV